MGLLEEWERIKRNESNPLEARKFALGNNTARLNPRQADYSNDRAKPKVGWDIGTGAGRTTSGDNPDLRRESDIIGPVPKVAEPQSLMDQLMEQLAQTYQPPQQQNMQSAQDAYNSYMSALDNALASKLGAIGNVRNQAQQNYETSDRNLTGMFGATAQNIATQGSAKYQGITDQHKGNLSQIRDESTAKLAADRDASMAKRQAMLKALGIEASGASVDPGQATLDNAITGITQRSDTALRGAEQAGATNQAYNQSVVNSVNQQGAERRAALTQQLQALQNQLGMAEAGAQNDTATQKAQLQMQFQQAQQEAQNAGSQQDYEMWNDRQNRIMDIWQTISKQEAEAQSAEPTKVQGWQGLATDLVNGGVPEQQAAGYMAALSEVLGSEYMKGIHPDEGYARSDIVGRRLQEPPYNIPPAIAQWIATNHSNLGNNAYYTAQ